MKVCPVPGCVWRSLGAVSVLLTSLLENNGPIPSASAKSPPPPICRRSETSRDVAGSGVRKAGSKANTRATCWRQVASVSGADGRRIMQLIQGTFQYRRLLADCTGVMESCPTYGLLAVNVRSVRAMLVATGAQG
jgi:hypothetical protein